MRIPALPLILAVGAWWTLYGLVGAGQMLAMDGPGGEVMSTRRALTLSLASGWLWIPLSLGLLWCVQRRPIRRGDLARSGTLFLLATLGVIGLRALAVWWLNPGVGWYRQLPAPADLLWASVLNNVVMVLLVIGAAHAWVYARRAAQREREAERLQASLVAARLEALRAQLDPHFLFNALNSIAEMVHRDVEAADRMLVGLGALLRASLDHRCQPDVALEDELRLLRHYLEIEAQRLGDRLRLSWQVQPGLDGVHVPSLMLQVLVENAIVHAVAQRVAPGHVAIRIRTAGDRLQVEVEDDGCGPRPLAGARAVPATGMSRATHAGTGLANLRARLACLHGDACEVSLVDNPGGGRTARVSLPLVRGATLADAA